MAPGTSRALVVGATAAVTASAGFTAAIGAWDVFVACLSCGFAVVVGWVVVHHDPTSPVGPAVAWTTASVAVVTAHVGPLARLPWSSGAWPLNLAGLLALMLVFPRGPSKGRPWCWAPWAFGGASLVVIALQWGSRQVDGRVVDEYDAPWLPFVGLACLLVLGGSLALAAASLVSRYRAGDQRTRQQVRWLLLAGLAIVVLLVTGWVVDSFGAPLETAYTPFLVAIVALVPTAVGVAIVRHDLFDVDRLLGAATTWVVTLVASAVVFAASVLVVSRAVSAGTGLSGAVAAFATALVLLPLQRHVAVWVGRLVDRDTHVAVARVDEFAADVRSGRRQPEEVESVLRLAQQDSDLVVLLARPDGGGWVRLDGTPAADAPDDVAIEAGGDTIAKVRLGWDSARARRRLADLASAAWVPLEVSRLRLILQETLHEAEASRQRLAESAAAERRRLERDLHDGAQQRLVATGLRLRLLQAHLGPVEAREVDAAVAELQGTVDELRRIAHGVRPHRLDDGLAAALVAVQQASPVPFDLQVGDLPDVSEARALTAYLVVNEAVVNTLKHARASRIAVAVAPVGDRIGVDVVDDGIGGVPPDASLPALRDRILSVGGTFEVDSPAGCGTTIRAVL